MKTKKPTKELIEIAHHEAGHAVAAIHQGIKVKSVTIAKQGITNGCCLIVMSKAANSYGFTPATRRRFRECVEREIIIGFAGRHGAELVARDGATGHEQDELAALETAKPLIPEHKERSAFVGWLWSRSRNLVTGPWKKDIIAVAKELLKVETMTGRQVREVIEANRRRPK